MLITKRKVYGIILNELNRCNADYGAYIKTDKTEQEKRDAFMLCSGQTTMAVSILTKLKGGRKNVRANNGRNKKRDAAKHSSGAQAN